MPETATPHIPSVAERRLDRYLLSSILLCPFSALTTVIVGYTVAHWTCDINRKTDSFIVAGVDFALCLVSAFLAYSAYRQLGPGDDTAPELDRKRFMAKLGLGLSAFSAVVVLAATCVVVTLNPCD
jgi:hypothetical protein